MEKITINNQIISIKDDYISLTDMARFKDVEFTGIIIANWLSTKYAIQFMSL